MQLFSQHDPAYDRTPLGKQTIHAIGCLLCSMGTLYQKHPLELLKVPGGVTAGGESVTGTLAAACGGKALPATTQAPQGWCIAVTDFYASVGFATHFFCVNMQTKQQIDPLDFPAKVEPLTYPIKHFRPFTNIKLDTAQPVPVPVYPDVEIGRWSEDAIRFCKEKGVMKGYDDGLFKPTQNVTREELAVVAQRLFQL